MPQPDLEREVRMVAVLAEPVRRALYEFVVSRAPLDVSREEAAKAVGIRRSLAAFHLDRLVESRLLEPVYRRLTGRSGPGAGRPAKLYRAGSATVEVSLPRRRYELMARLLLSALQAAPDAARLDDVRTAARRHGAQLGAWARQTAGDRPLREVLGSVLDGEGFQAFVDGSGQLRMRNCPFSALTADFCATVCTVNLALHEGLLQGLGTPDLIARLAPEPSLCCVTISSPGG